MSDSAEELEPLVADLAETLAALEQQVDAEPSQRRALLRFTERYAIPTTVALLEANIRVLEAVGGAIRLAEGREPEERSGRTGETALATLDRALAEVNDAVRGTPTDSDARRLLTNARDLRAEIDDRLAESSEDSATTPTPTAGGTTIPVSDATRDDGSGVDVDAELDTIRREVHGDEPADTDASGDGEPRGDDGG